MQKRYNNANANANHSELMISFLRKLENIILVWYILLVKTYKVNE
jgi:hypothetical protein